MLTRAPQTQQAGHMWHTGHVFETPDLKLCLIAFLFSLIRYKINRLRKGGAKTTLVFKPSGLKDEKIRSKIQLQKNCTISQKKCERLQLKKAIVL